MNELHDQKVLNNEQLELVKLNFSEIMLFLTEKDLKASKQADGTRYSEDVKQYAASCIFTHYKLRKYF